MKKTTMGKQMSNIQFLEEMQECNWVHDECLISRLIRKRHISKMTCLQLIMMCFNYIHG